MSEPDPRRSDYPIDPIFLARWSPRAFSGEPVAEADLRTMFEAARWAPSSYNSQPWRFFYAVAGTPQFAQFLGLLVEFNQSWAKTAGALVILAAKETMQLGDKSVPSRTFALDAGAAWGYLALEAARLGYMTHAMAGIDLERTRTALKLPDGISPQIAIAVGRIGDKASLPEGLRDREYPSPRLPQTDFAFAGGFPAA
jgi:nitroreductase